MGHHRREEHKGQPATCAVCNKTLSSDSALKVGTKFLNVIIDVVVIIVGIIIIVVIIIVVVVIIIIIIIIFVIIIFFFFFSGV
jgi:hypothetical protein